ncbi:MAG: rod shape-determining protein MreC [Halomonas sp.]|uniref:rod shape-determining protein MreC n=1 Tax=Halomonas sp. TaxID=1486246 RepID=UPI003F8F0D20
MLLCVLIASLLMFGDLRYPRMGDFRERLTTVVAPIQWLVSLPSEALDWATLALSDQRRLLEENRLLREQVLSLSHRVQRMNSLMAENIRLRELLDAAPEADIAYITAELLSLDPDPYTHRMVIDRGRRDGVYPGQPVMDATGLIGQVTDVSTYASRMLLVSDASHALPVQVNRNGLRFILQGTGHYDELSLLHVSNTDDVREGDLLMTSGMAGRFPPGYPVARVSSVIHDPGQPFARVIATPVARLKRSRHFMLLFPPEQTAVPGRGGWGEILSPEALDGALELNRLIQEGAEWQE